MRTIDLSADREVISKQLTAALMDRVGRDGAETVIKSMIDSVLGHSFVDDDLEVDLQKALVGVAQTGFINDPNPLENDDDED